MYNNLRVSVVEQMNTLRSISLEIFHESDYPEERLKQEIELLINDDLRLQIRQTFNSINYNIEKKRVEVTEKRVEVTERSNNKEAVIEK